MRSRKAVTDLAKRYVGCVQGDMNHANIIDTYNGHTPLPRGYKVRYTDAWCATFVSAISIMLGYTDIIPLECSCNRMIDLLKVIGCFEERDDYVPSEGDIIFYDWDDNGAGDCKGIAEHVGIVCSTDGRTIKVIEGNKGSKHECGYRTININGQYIRGYGVPRYDIESPKNVLYDGDEIKLKDGATYYNGKSIPGWVKKSKLYYRGENQNGIIFSVLRSGAITGVTKKENIIKIQ